MTERQELSDRLQRSRRVFWRRVALIYLSALVALLLAYVAATLQHARKTRLGPSADEIMLRSAPTGPGFDHWVKRQAEMQRMEYARR